MQKITWVTLFLTVDAKCDVSKEDELFTGIYDAIGQYRRGVVYVQQTPTGSGGSYLYREWVPGSYLDWENGIVGWKFKWASPQPEVGSFIGDQSDEHNQILPLNKDTEGK